MKNACIVATVAILAGPFAAQAQPQSDGPAPDWIIAKNQPCKIWNPQPQPNESVTWTGACKGGFASGKGVLRWTENGKPDMEFDGEYANGKRNGPGVIVAPDGKRMAGVWVDDEAVPRDSKAI